MDKLIPPKSVPPPSSLLQYLVHDNDPMQTPPTTEPSVAFDQNDTNSVAVVDEMRQEKRTNYYGLWISALSNLSIQYNLVVIAPALLLLDHTRVSGGNGSSNDAAFPRTDEEDAISKSAVFFGTIIGQCTMGLIGDIIGSLSLAMILTNCIALVGTIGCMCSPLYGVKSSHRVYTVLAIFRVVLGVGVGGKYPLSSAMRAEEAEADAQHEKIAHRAREVANGFFWQTPGSILPYIVALLLLLIVGDEQSGVGKNHLFKTKLQYVILVGLGAIPSICVLILLWRQRMSENKPQQNCVNHDPQGLTNADGFNLVSTDENCSRSKAINPLTVVFRNKKYWSKLFGTGMSWALYDFVYYGTAFNQPEILSRVLGSTSSLIAVSWRDAMVSMMGIPGVILAIQIMKPIGGPKPLQGWGFVSIGWACVFLLTFYVNGHSAGHFAKWGEFVACCILIFSLNCGCNVSTYVLPMEMFSKDVRSTFHGVSAGMGKLGALLGNLVFPKLNMISICFTFAACICSCLVGVCVTFFFIDPPRQNTFFVVRPARSDSINKDSEEESSAILTKHENQNETDTISA